MTKTQFRLGVVAVLAAILLFNLTSPDRYKLLGTSGSLLVDGVTGKTWVRSASTSGKWEPIDKQK